jgi:hypothetical protein
VYVFGNIMEGSRDKGFTYSSLTASQGAESYLLHFVNISHIFG